MYLLYFYIILILSIFINLVISATNKDIKYEVYWNIPTFMCHKYGIYFDVEKYGIIKNKDDQFKGEKVLILYDPGEFPAFLTGEVAAEHEEDYGLGRQANVVARNGGLPQLGDLNLHLKAMRKLIDEEVPDVNFDGIGVLDFESWRPTFRQNWASLNLYREKSRSLERRLHPFWTKESIEAEAKRRFEHHGRQFMERTLELVREMRPRATWGYYTFPYCFNYTPKNRGFDCPAEVKQENNALGWLYSASDALYPSLYMSRQKLRPEQHHKFIYGRLVEARRLAGRVKSTQPDVLPYVWYRYYDEQAYLTEEDLIYSVGTGRTLNMRGTVLWGSSKDFANKEKCQRFSSYVHETLGPTIKYIIDTPLSQLEDRIEGRRSHSKRSFWTTYFLEPIASILE